MSVEEELRAFDEGRIEPAAFPHREHVRFAFEILGRASFGEAAMRFRLGLAHIARKAGKPQLYHETITIAFLAVIAERRATTATTDWAEFIERNAELLDKNLLLRWYSKEQLESELARQTFCLPR
ncbi:MAG: hypothetical protein M3Y86_12515 [Verrucomicrobiota bacterium]|nr:hypothetical protein [Verrucomicrobiota bacterium]